MPDFGGGRYMCKRANDVVQGSPTYVYIVAHFCLPSSSGTWHSLSNPYCSTYIRPQQGYRHTMLFFIFPLNIRTSHSCLEEKRRQYRICELAQDHSRPENDQHLTLSAEATSLDRINSSQVLCVYLPQLIYS
ncbi:unnamed protein product [Ectocarpus sp. 4 AP-2014]